MNSQCRLFQVKIEELVITSMYVKRTDTQHSRVAEGWMTGGRDAIIPATTETATISKANSEYRPSHLPCRTPPTSDDWQRSDQDGEDYDGEAKPTESTQQRRNNTIQEGNAAEKSRT